MRPLRKGGSEETDGGDRQRKPSPLVSAFLLISANSCGFPRVHGKLFLRTPHRHTIASCACRRMPPASCGTNCGMKVTIKNWHAVASWTWTTEDDVCGICRAWLSSLPVLSESFVPRSRAPLRASRCALSQICRSTGVRPVRRVQETTRLSFGAGCALSLLSHTTPCPPLLRATPQGLLCCAHAVFALLPPDVHHDMAAQQKYMPNLPPKVGVCICTQAGPGDAWRPAAWRGICSSRSGRTRRRLSFMGRDLSAGPLSGVALMSSARAGERCRDSPMRRSHYNKISRAGYASLYRVDPGRPSRLPGAARTAVPGYPVPALR